MYGTLRISGEALAILGVTTTRTSLPGETVIPKSAIFGVSVGGCNNTLKPTLFVVEQW